METKGITELKSPTNWGQIAIIILLVGIITAQIGIFAAQQSDQEQASQNDVAIMRTLSDQQSQLSTQQAQIITLLQALPGQPAAVATPDPAHVDAMHQLQSSALILETMGENELDAFNTNCFDASIAGIYQQQFCAQQFQVEQLSIISQQLYNLAQILTK